MMGKNISYSITQTLQVIIASRQDHSRINRNAQEC